MGFESLAIIGCFESRHHLFTFRFEVSGYEITVLICCVVGDHVA